MVEPFIFRNPSTNQSLLSSIGSSTIMNEDAERYFLINSHSRNNTKIENRMPLGKFCRMYRIGKFPFIDFIVIYLIIYLFNRFFFEYDYRWVILVAILATILINLGS